MDIKRYLKVGALTSALLLPMVAFAQKDPNLAKTPPMGWNSWNKFQCNLNEQMVREIADAMVATGMRDAGYEYVVMDDCWHGKRDSLGFIQPNPEHFPSGIKALADYVHSKGLKLGIYSCAGNTTCAHQPASRGHEYQDALQYAKWGIDYLKYDWCDTEGLNAQGAYTTMAEAIMAAGRPILFSLCEWGNNKPWEWGPSVGHMWRTTGDIFNCFDCIKEHGTWQAFGVMQILDKQNGLRQYAGPGHWNDPDMLEVGNGMPVNQDRAHFSMWVMLAAPLIAGNDIRNMSQETLEILTNREAIAINQDSLGIQGFRQAKDGDLETWLKPLANGDWALCFLNRGKEPRAVELDWNDFRVTDDLSKLSIDTSKDKYTLRDVWQKKNLGKATKKFKATVLAQDVILLRISKTVKR